MYSMEFIDMQQKNFKESVNILNHYLDKYMVYNLYDTSRQFKNYMATGKRKIPSKYIKRLIVMLDKEFEQERVIEAIKKYYSSWEFIENGD